MGTGSPRASNSFTELRLSELREKDSGGPVSPGPPKWDSDNHQQRDRIHRQTGGAAGLGIQSIHQGIGRAVKHPDKVRYSDLLQW